MTTTHGPNFGHGYAKVVVNRDGVETMTVFPAQIAKAQRALLGTTTRIESVQAGGSAWWVGEDAQFDNSPQTFLGQERLLNGAFLPALVRSANARLDLQPEDAGWCVSGLPADWAADEELRKQLGSRLREGTDLYTRVLVVAEPVAVAQSVLLGPRGEAVGDPDLERREIGIVDLGHLTVDVCTIKRSTPVPGSLATWELGTSRPLKMIRSQFAVRARRTMSLYETDQAIRAGALAIGDQTVPLPDHWDRPLRENAEAIVDGLREAWGSATHLHSILIAGGGAELPQQVQAICRAFPQARVVPEPQLAIPRGYGRLAQRLARKA